MKVTYYENLPLDGAGTMLHPAYKWLRVERTEFCDTIMKVGNLWYMYRSGFIYHSIEVDKITCIEYKDRIAKCVYEKGNQYPFSASIDNKDGEHICNVGSKDFKTIIERFFYDENIR